MFTTITNNISRSFSTCKTLGLPKCLQKLAALAGVLVISPLLIATAIAIRLESKGPVLFKQTRVGVHGKLFTMYKFRSMYTTTDPRFVMPTKSDRNGVCEKFYDDPRITAVGKIIRKFSIDELPQLFNVIKGDMLLIGPRPALPKEVDQYQLAQLDRLEALPGITGLWQVSGRADIAFDEQVLLDIRYIQERSFLLDLKILFATVPAVIGAKGAY